MSPNAYLKSTKGETIRNDRCGQMGIMVNNMLLRWLRLFKSTLFNKKKLKKIVK